MTKRTNPRPALAMALGLALVVSLLTGLGSDTPAKAGSGVSYPSYEFVNNGSGALPWNAYNLSAATGAPYPVGDPAAVASSNRLAVYSRSSSGAVLQTVNDNLNGHYWNTYDLTAVTHATPAASAPTAVVSSTGTMTVSTTATNGHLVIYTWKPGNVWHQLDLTATGRAPNVTGPQSMALNGNGLPTLAARGTDGHLLVAVRNQDAKPYWSVTDVTKVGGTSTIASVPAISLGPDGSQLWVAAMVPGNKLGLFVNDNATGRFWSTRTVGVNGYPTTIGGAPDLGVFQGQLTAFVRNATGSLLKVSASSLSQPVTWKVVNLTATTGSATVEGRPSMVVNGDKLRVYLRASFGDLVQYGRNFADTGSSWQVRDVSVTAGSGRNIGNLPAAVLYQGQVHVFAGANVLPPPTGTGVYAYPDPPANTVAEGWKIIGSHGALGTCSSPWVGERFTGADQRVGSAIQASGKRITWLSFWTVSGPGSSAGGGCSYAADQSPAAFYRNGKAAGRWVATQIAAYRGRGLALKPDWVILDPEGYPDNHSGLDQGLGQTQTDRWFQMLAGWRDGINAVDPTLKPGVYATMSEYRNYGLTNLTMPVFLAVAFGGGGPYLIDGGRGPNVLGVIAWGAQCSEVATQSRVFNGPPWNGRYNTIQFDAGVDCPPR